MVRIAALLLALSFAVPGCAKKKGPQSPASAEPSSEAAPASGDDDEMKSSDAPAEGEDREGPTASDPSEDGE